MKNRWVAGSRRFPSDMTRFLYPIGYANWRDHTC